MCLRKMGYDNVNMESKRGKASPVSGCTMNSVRRQSSRSSPFCPGSSSWTTQSIVTDHMISHYKKIYSAKAAIDTSVPKSLIGSIRYNDQIKRERLMTGCRPESAQSLSLRNCRSSCSSTQGKRSVQGEGSPYFHSRGSIISSPRLNTSFHVKQIVYAAPETRDDPQPLHPSPELSYRSPVETPYRQHSARSSATTAAQSGYKTFQDPVEKTYGGDLLHKHSHCFTHDIPFAPKILKSDKNSYLSKYRYYTAPQTKPRERCTKPGLMRQKTYHGSLQADKFSTTEFDGPPQGFTTRHEWSDDECNGLNVSISNKQLQTNKCRSNDFHYSSSRASPECTKSSIMMKTSAEEEELMYLEFLADVTNYILSKGIFSDRVLDRVFERHIAMNRHRLDEGEMRHLLEDLRKDFDVPVDTPVSCIEAGRNDRYLNRMRLPSFESEVLKSPERKEENDHQYSSRITDCDSPEGAVPVMPPHCNYPESTVAPSQENTKPHLEGSGPPWLSGSGNQHLSISEETIHQNQAVADPEDVSQEFGGATSISNVLHHPKSVPGNYDELSVELEDLRRGLSNTLHVSSRPTTPDNNNGTTNEEDVNVFVSVSDDEF